MTEFSVGPERRSFLKLMAASLALSGLAGETARADPRDREVPFVNQPEGVNPSAPLYFASSSLIDGFANGVLVTTRDGRPLKIEGNPQHPWCRGGTDIFAQASVLGLYDPQRSAEVRFAGRASSWQAFRAAMAGKFGALRADGGKGLRLLTGPVTSPSLLAQIAALQRIFPSMRWHDHAAIDRSGLFEGTQRAFGRRLETQWRFERARTVVAFDGDFLDNGPHQIGLSRRWIDARREAIASGGLLEMHCANAVPNLTSAKADHPLVATPSEIAALADALLARVSGARKPPPSAGGSPQMIWLERATAALQAARGASLVIAGSTQPPEIQETVHRINAALGNIGQSVFYTMPIAGEAAPIGELAADIDGGAVQALLMLDVNPAYDAPADLEFGRLLGKVPLKIHAGLYEDETADRADWHLPSLHPLEAWGDARSVDGTVGFMQPTIEPLYGGRSAAEILSLLVDTTPRGGLDLLRSHWQGGSKADEFGPEWQKMLLDGFVANSALPPEAVQVKPASTPAPAANTAGLDLIFRPDPTIRDGSVANNAWLQELPKPLTKLVWSNVVSVSPLLAEREHLAQGDVVTVTAGSRNIEGPIWILPGQADDTVAVTLGYGRQQADKLFDGLGYDAYALRESSDPWRLRGVALRKSGRKARLVTTQDHSTMEGHDFVRVQHLNAPPVGDPPGAARPALYDYTADYQQTPDPVQQRAWGMVIDLDACIGCNACVTACQSENNIAVVGVEQVALGRDMHWLRVDRYYEGGLDAPKTHFQPVPCMHCEDAPCEVGCPVEATLHDHEGLNLMVYNRCIGTRACSGYCPYKVRHFNYLDYSAGAAPTIALMHNPEVTVRARGVMEKCTYCVQRIAEARIESDKTDTPIPDGRVQTACQGACPTRAITFGDINDKGSAVAAAKRDPRNYALLGELNTKPRTTYIAEMAPARTES